MPSLRKLGYEDPTESTEAVFFSRLKQNQIEKKKKEGNMWKNRTEKRCLVKILCV